MTCMISWINNSRKSFSLTKGQRSCFSLTKGQRSRLYYPYWQYTNRPFYISICISTLAVYAAHYVYFTQECRTDYKSYLIYITFSLENKKVADCDPLLLLFWKLSYRAEWYINDFFHFVNMQGIHKDDTKPIPWGYFTSTFSRGTLHTGCCTFHVTVYNYRILHISLLTHVQFFGLEYFIKYLDR